MAKKTAMTELRKMQLPDLEREITAKRMHLTKVQLGVGMRQEKDTAKVRFERRELARLLTARQVLWQSQNEKGALKTSQKTATVSAPASAKAKLVLSSAEGAGKPASGKRAPKAAKSSTPKK